MEEDWELSLGKLTRIQDLLKPFREDVSLKSSPLVASLDRALTELEVNAGIIHDISNVHRSVGTAPSSHRREAILQRSELLLKELYEGISKVIGSVAPMAKQSP